MYVENNFVMGRPIGGQGGLWTLTYLLGNARCDIFSNISEVLGIKIDN